MVAVDIDIIGSLLDLHNPEIARQYDLWDLGDCSLIGLIKILLNKVETEDILLYPAADLFTNAPRALIQLSLEVQSDLLRTILGKEKLDFNMLREMRNKK